MAEVAVSSKELLDGDRAGAGVSVEPFAGRRRLPLDPAPEEMRSMADAVVEALVAWIGGLDDAPADATEERSTSRGGSRRTRPSSAPADLDALLEEALEAARHTFEYSGPGYLAYIPGGGLYTAALAEFLAQGLNRYVGLWQPSPAIVQLEENVTRWLCGLFDFPAATSQGVLTTGGLAGEPLGRGDGPPREARPRTSSTARTT